MFFCFGIYNNISRHTQTLKYIPRISLRCLRYAAGEGRRRATEARLASSEPFATRRFEQSGYAKKHSYHFGPPVPDQT